MATITGQFPDDVPKRKKKGITWKEHIRKYVMKPLHPFIVNHQTSLMSNTAGELDQLHLGRVQFWGDKLMILIDFFQIMGLYWITANPWPLPYPWVTWTRWWTAFNIDVFSFLESGALAGMSGNTSISKWGSYSGYLNTFVLPYVLATFLIAFVYWRYTQDIMPAYSKSWNEYQPALLKFTLHALNFLYLPTGIVAFRALYCYENVNERDLMYYGEVIMAADETQVCYQGWHLLYFLMVLFLYVPIFLGLPVFIYRLIADNIVYILPPDHEKRLQAWEIGQMLRLDQHYSVGQVWLLAGHTRSSAYYRVWMLCYKAILLLLYAFCRGTGSGDDNSYKVVQATLMWLVTIAYVARFCVFNRGHAPFRITSSSIIFYTCFIVLLCNMTIGVFNAAGVNNAMMVNSTQTLVLASVNGGGYAIILLTLLVISTNPYALWPSVRTIHRIESNQHFRLLVRRWLSVLNQAVELRSVIQVTPNAIVDAPALEKCIKDLRSCWLAARHSGSIFELIIGEFIEELFIMHDLRKTELCRTNKEWDTAYKDSMEDGVFTRYNHKYRLMAPRKRRILTKLLALRILQQREPEVDTEFLSAMTDVEMKTAMRKVTLLERSTRELLDRGVMFEKRREDEVLSVAKSNTRASTGYSTKSAKEVMTDRVATHGNFIASPSEIHHMADIEEALYRWENIIDVIEDYTYEHPFTRRLFTMNRMENWYSFRTLLLTQIAAFGYYFGSEHFEGSAYVGMNDDEHDDGNKSGEDAVMEE